MLGDYSKLFKVEFDVENVKISIEFYKGFFRPTESNSQPHSHKFFEVHHIISGSVRIFFDNRMKIANRGETYLVAPGVMHYITNEEVGSVKSSFCFSFSRLKKNTDLDLYEIYRSAFGNISGITKIPDSSEHMFFLSKIFALFNSDRPTDKLKFKTNFMLLITCIAESLMPSDTSLPAKKYDLHSEYDIRHFIMEEFIQSNFDKNITIADLAATMHLSEKQTSRIFKRDFGHNFQEYLISIRLENSKSMLADSNVPVSDIAAAVGYNAYNGFYNMFVKQTGMTPLQYRKKILQKRETE